MTTYLHVVKGNGKADLFSAVNYDPTTKSINKHPYGAQSLAELVGKEVVLTDGYG